MGTIKGIKAKVNIEINSQPKFMKARGVPFAMKKAVKAEIDRMEKDGILKSVPYSERASPIVIVPKPDGTIRICADYKRIANPDITNNTYLQPTPNGNGKLFSKIQGGEKFSKIDLMKAYLQVELDDESQKYLTINTSKGLKQPTRMLYGVNPATGIFHRFIENAFVKIPYTAAKIDDILSGKTDMDHLENIEKVFRVLKEIGDAVNKKKCMFFWQINQVCWVYYIQKRYLFKST